VTTKEGKNAKRLSGTILAHAVVSPIANNYEKNNTCSAALILEAF